MSCTYRFAQPRVPYRSVQCIRRNIRVVAEQIPFIIWIMKREKFRKKKWFRNMCHWLDGFCNCRSNNWLTSAVESLGNHLRSSVDVRNPIGYVIVGEARWSKLVILTLRCVTAPRSLQKAFHVWALLKKVRFELMAEGRRRNERKNNEALWTGEHLSLRWRVTITLEQNGEESIDWMSEWFLNEWINQLS